jgi:zinc/manganese transport system substrate-binding protein
MKSKQIVLALVFATLTLGGSAWASPPLKVVTTLPDYDFFAKVIGGDRISSEAIVHGDQDAHFIRPKPSFVKMVRSADVLVATGLDLELWLPTIVNKSGNNRIRSGQPGYVSASQGVRMLEKPKVLSRAEGGVHIYGNPHITTSPINVKVAARNILIGLVKNDPEGRDIYQANLDKLLDEIDERLFGRELVEILGGDALCKMAEKGTLIPFLEKRQLRGKPLIDYLGGWMKKMMPLRGKQIVTYHKNWAYFEQLFGLEELGTVEPKPGIPPAPRHVTELVDQMQARNVRIILAANYFDEHKIRTVADRVGAEAAIVPLLVGGKEGIEDYFQLVDCWVDALLGAAQRKNLLETASVGGRPE